MSSRPNPLRQAAEKTLGAVRPHRELVNTKDRDLAMLIDGRAGGGEPFLCQMVTPG
jgi:hypothetical protein